MKKIIIAGFFIVAMVFGLKAQSEIGNTYMEPHTMINIDYGMGFGIGDFKEFIDAPSYSGFSIDARKFLNSSLSVGGGFGLNPFNKKFDRGTYEFEGGAITGTKWTYAFVMPLFANIHYYIGQDLPIKPFVGLNTGAYYTEYEVQLGSYVYRDKNWRFGLSPEIGFYVPIGGSGLALNVKGKYNHIFYNKNNINGWQYLGVDVGITLMQ